MSGGLSGMFDPDRVAVVGATDRADSVGRALMENLLADFDGEAVPVNPGRDRVLDRECYPDVGSVPDPVDVAVVVVPAAVAVDAVREAAEAGVESVVVITAGFGETGGEGAARERDLRAVADEYDLDLVGPNSIGVLSTPAGLNATFAPTMALPGDISFMSQSGAFITAVLSWAEERGLGFKDIVSLGNKTVLDEVDFVDHWGDDPDTSVVLGYLEDVSDGRAFIETARETTGNTPLVVVKSGWTDAGAQAASSHTGAIAGSERAYEAGMDQAGAIRVETVEELFDFAQVLSGQPLPDTDDVAVVTNAGGPGVMATDAIGASDLSLASFAESTRADLRAVLPDETGADNPLDLIGDATVDRFRDTLDTVLRDDGVGGAVVIACPTATFDYADLAAVIRECDAAHDKPLVTCLMGGERATAAARALDDDGIPNYFDPARAVRSLDALARYRAISEREYDAPAEFDVDRERAREVLESVERRENNRLGVEAMDLLDAYGIDTPRGEILTDPTDAEAVARRYDGPVVMKIVSPDILHKSDIGGVRVGVPNDEVYDTFETLVARAHNYQSDATVLGVQVQESVDIDAGVETIVGMNRDPQFGPLLLFGLGGIFVEILEDSSFRVAPVSEREARTMTEEIDSAPLLRGARGRDSTDVDAVVEAIQRLSQLVTDFPAIEELDINPLVALPDGAQAVDIRLTVNPTQL
ncbi:acetate--CoA ligase family protein [Candidatus Halobonum tyrrellensis]|uniref:acetate--CoA ligase (ADP-forming) n=1 Tax=Candidatus Halobonum tyrrellensis G22 TaxID=1324957 RepID=V4HGW4_9EURY|nr:acetate--CoA ligase [Candidatus Halobonum tyrrellensis]ESP89950.1 acyl-CoA synthetase [Candidatus Halobonum tyrrellensis G22]